MKGLVRSLPANKRDEVRQILRKHRETVRPLRRALREEGGETWPRMRDLQRWMWSSLNDDWPIGC